jgi:UDP-N-acetylglucosamine diphosphorylase/glucosamine-1-phosphate N-acetyltransferase
VSPTAEIFGSIINVTDGPVWIDDDAEIMEGSLIRGPFYLGKSSVVKMGAKIYGPTAIGPHCKVGGELGNVSFQGYSNKAHDGFLGNSVIGQWCNLGADTNCSNLKNNYSVVKQYDYVTQKEESTGLNFCGLMMGDYSKCGINTMWNTGSVVGVCVNFYGAGFPKKHLPDFYWGDANTGELYDLKKALETIAIVKSRRGIEVTENERQILTALHAMSIA